MAQIHEEVVAIKINKLVKNGATTSDIMTPEIASALAELAEQMLNEISPGVIVEVVDLGE